MKRFLSPVLSLIAVAAMAQEAGQPARKEGADRTPAAVASALWIQVEPLKAFEPGMVYLFGCWATWCGPRVAAIPQITRSIRNMPPRAHAFRT